MQFLLYCMCGGLGVALDYGTYHLSLQAGLWYQYANALGYLAGTLLSFVLNRVFTFGRRDRVIQRLALFLSVAGAGLTASMVMLWILIDLAGLDARWAKITTLPVVVVLQYSLNRRFTFKD